MLLLNNRSSTISYCFRRRSSRDRSARLPCGGMLLIILAGCGGGSGGNGNDDNGANSKPVPVAHCSTTPQGNQLAGFLEAFDRDNSSSELTFSLDPNVPRVTGPIQTAKGMVELLDVTTGEFRYIPNSSGPRGTDSFEFRVDDPESFAIAIETIIVNPAIMPLGDSITDGTLGKGTPPEEQRVGYRRKLFKDLTASGFMIDFVGSRSSGEAATPPIDDPDHEGHPGATAEDIADNIRLYLNLNPADVVLLHIGTNNINTDGIDAVTRAAQVGQILDEIDQWERDNNTPVTVFLAQIIDRSNPDAGSFPNPRVDAFNTALVNMVEGRSTDDIIVVDQHNALNYACENPDSASCDMTKQEGGFIHPDEDGYEKMATTWLGSIESSGRLPKCN